MKEKVDYLYDKDRNDGLTVALNNAPPELFENHDQAERKPQPQEAPRLMPTETRTTSSRASLPRNAKPVILTIQYGLLNSSFAQSMSFPTGTKIGDLKWILAPLVPNLSHDAMTLTLKANNALTVHLRYSHRTRKRLRSCVWKIMLLYALLNVPTTPLVWGTWTT